MNTFTEVGWHTYSAPFFLPELAFRAFPPSKLWQVRNNVDELWNTRSDSDEYAESTF
jgi:hypothetical protein